MPVVLEGYLCVLNLNAEVRIIVYKTTLKARKHTDEDNADTKYDSMKAVL
jgi:hypothetical protein